MAESTIREAPTSPSAAGRGVCHRTTQRSLSDRLMTDCIDQANAARAGVTWLDERITSLELRVAGLETRNVSSSVPGTVEVRSPGGWRTRAPAWAGVLIAFTATVAVALWQLL